MRLLRLETSRAVRRARRAVLVVGVLGLGAILLGQPVVGQTLVGCALLGLILLESFQLRRLIEESDRQQYALTQIRPLAGQLPLDFSQWAADPLLIHNAVRLVLESRPSLVVECGSGSSTVVLARCLQAMGGGRLLSLEHDPQYAERTSQLLRAAGLENVATVVTAPLVTRSAGAEVFRWYGPEYEPFVTQPIDLLLVDGPPGGSSSRARYPAIPLLRQYLAPGCSILLDDGDREDERAIARLWAQLLNGSLTYLKGGRGGWLLRRTGLSAPVTGLHQ